jgi:galactokinase
MQKIETHLDLSELIDINREYFNKEFKKIPEFIVDAPGRINIIGEHTDYNQGLAMPAGINRWILIGFSSRKDEEIHIKSWNFKSELKFSLNTPPALSENWQKYVYGAVTVFRERVLINQGFDAYILGNISIGSGVSSSAALEVAMLNGLRKLYNSNIDDLTLVRLCQKIENDHFQIKSGLLDQYASQFSREGKILLLDFRSLEHEYINTDMDDWQWVVVDAKVKTEPADSKYSERVKETAEALHFLMEVDPFVKNFRDLNESHIAYIDNDLWKRRLKHYITENRRVQVALELIKGRDFEALGKVLINSHNSLKYDYEVSRKELDFLVHSAITYPFCSGSRMMGRGFEGCTLNLLRKEGIPEFKKFISDSYKTLFGVVPQVESYTIVNGVSIKN